MDLKKWEPTVEAILEESNREPKESGKYKVLTAWRAKLEQAPNVLQPFQIDAVVREVRRRMDSGNRRAS